MGTSAKVGGLAAVFAAGALLAGLVATGGIAADTTTTEVTTETATTLETTTEPGTTVVTTATVEQTTTRQIILPATTTAGSESGGETPAWVWVLVGLLAVGLVIAIVLLLTRRGGSGAAVAAVPADERRRRLDMAVSSWAAQGWALESQSADSAVLQRAGERMIVGIDPAGQVTTRPLGGPP